MKRLLLPFLAIVLFAGCAGFDQREIAYLRASGVPSRVVMKMGRGEPLTPPELIALARHRVPDSFALRHLEDAGVNYVVTRSDVLRMRRGGVSARVIDALLVECDRFAADYARTPTDVSVGMWWSDSSYIGNDLYFDDWW